MTSPQRLLVSLFLVLALAGCTTVATEPRPAEPSTPTFAFTRAPVSGAINPDVRQDTIHQTICVPGWTKTIRPPVAWTDALKHRLLLEQHLPGRVQDYELDHLVPLEGGGHPRSLENLWMQPLTEAHVKDAEENAAHQAVCAGTRTLHEAQAAMLKRWGRP